MNITMITINKNIKKPLIGPFLGIYLPFAIESIIKNNIKAPKRATPIIVSRLSAAFCASM